MNYYAQNVEKSTKNVLISLNAVVDFTNTCSTLNAYFNFNEKAYKAFVDKAALVRKPSDLTKANSLLSLPPKPYVLDFLKKVMLYDEFNPYFFYPRFNCQVENYYPQMRNWMNRHLSKEFAERIQIISLDCVNSATVLIESNSTFQLTEFSGLYVKMGSEDCPNWKAVYSLLDHQINSCTV